MLNLSSKLALSWPAGGNLYARQGTLAFFFRTQEDHQNSPMPIFRVSSADSSTWDFDWLRIDWNGNGFEAFVTDIGQARIRIKSAVLSPTLLNTWQHLTFAWDERWGIKLWLNGELLVEKQQLAHLDQELWGMGPMQRIIAPWKVESGFSFDRTGMLDDVKTFDVMLSDNNVKRLFNNRSIQPQPALNNQLLLSHWNTQQGFEGYNQPLLIKPNDVIGVKKVATLDARDNKQTVFKGVDGIRETSWPGMYNRSKLPGRSDYFILPDWNLYSSSGSEYQISLANEPWNWIEVFGSAQGVFKTRQTDGSQLLVEHRTPLPKTSLNLGRVRTGGNLELVNDSPGVPINELGVYHVGAVALPKHGIALNYQAIPTGDISQFANLAPLQTFIEQRYLARERENLLVALPKAANLRQQPKVSPPSKPHDAGLPLVHVVLPADFRTVATGGAPTRFSYTWQNLHAGLDGVLLSLPALPLIVNDSRILNDNGTPKDYGVIPINIRLKDPNWPARDLIDITLPIAPGSPQTVWLDSQDIILPTGKPLYLTLASNQPAFNSQLLKGMEISLRFKPYKDAIASHRALRLEQARDNLANLVEEQPNVRLFPLWERFERDINELLKVDPTNPLGRSLWYEKNPEQRPTGFIDKPSSSGAPAWAVLQREYLQLYKAFVNWWIDHRQLTSGPAMGEFGGGIADDTDLTNHWVGLALMGVNYEKIRRSQRMLLQASYNNGLWQQGLNTLKTDELHAYEEGTNAVAQALQLNWGSPSVIHQALAVAQNYPRLIQKNTQGHSHFISNYFSASDIDQSEKYNKQTDRSFLITHPGLLLVDYNNHPATRSLLLSALDGWLAHAGDQGTLPKTILWRSDQGQGRGAGLALHNFWAAYRWTNNQRYLAPVIRLIESIDLTTIGALNANILSQLGASESLMHKISSGEISGTQNYIDANLGGMDSQSLVDFARWQATGDTNNIAQLHQRELAMQQTRLPYLTEAEAWTDRVAMPTESLQRSRLGGVAHLRNAYYPGNLVSWQFNQKNDLKNNTESWRQVEVSGEDVAILFAINKPTEMTFLAYNFKDTPIVASATGWDVEHGIWSVTSNAREQGLDTERQAPSVEFGRARTVDISLPPHQLQMVTLKRQSALSPVNSYPDIGIEPGDINNIDRANGRLAFDVTIHSLGSVPTPPGLLLIKNSAGEKLQQFKLKPMQAMSENGEDSQVVAVELPSETVGDELTLDVRLLNKTEEITASNNTLCLLEDTLKSTSDLTLLPLEGNCH
ncbi:LamG domain-containing protein [Halioxenophilus aromaticivorans]|uniref:LamG domain-containing protein n=1 Tax=Halioxenophilus aromaticivorans TaxID=1306992 RepID=A0AAV3U7X6_9ALTE